MKGEIQFWGQTHRHTDICTSRAASSQLKIWIFPFCQRMSLKIKLKPLSLNFRRDTRVLDRYFYLYSLQSTYKCYFWYFILGKNAYKNSQCGIKSQKNFKSNTFILSFAMRTLYFQIFIMVIFFWSMDSSERTKNTFWTKRSTFRTKRFDIEAKNPSEMTSKLATLGGPLQDLLTRMHRKNLRECVYNLAKIPPGMCYLFYGLW